VRRAVTLAGKWLINVNQTVATEVNFDNATYPKELNAAACDHSGSAFLSEPLNCQRHVGTTEVDTLEEERLALFGGKRIGEAVAKIKLSGIAAAFTKIAVRESDALSVDS